MSDGGSAQPVTPVTDRMVSAAPALRVAVVSDGRPVLGGPSQPVYVVTDNRPTQGNTPVPVVLATGVQASNVMAGPAIPVVVVSGSLNPAPPFTPTDIAGLTLWLKADALAQSDGTAIASWLDSSGSGNTATQATGTKQPTFKTAIQNGLPVARFDGGDGLITPIVDFLSAGTLSIYVACKLNAGASDYMLVEATPAYSSNNGAFIFYRQSNGKTFAALKSSTGQPIWQSYRLPTTARFQVISGLFDLSLPNSASFTADNNAITFQDGLRDNGTNGLGTGNTTGTPTFANNILYIGARNQSNTFLNGDIGEMLIYRGRHTAAQQRQVHNYLNAKWGLAAYTNGLVAYIGDSMTAGTNTTSSYPLQADALLIADGYSFNYGNYGRNGTQCPEMETYAISSVDPFIGMNGGKNIAVIWGGTNDLYFGQTALATEARYQSLCAGRRAAGFKVIALTILPRSDASVPGTFETSRQAFNTWLRANYTTFADALYDCAADARIGDAGDELDTTYYTTDKVHLNASAGLPIIAAGVKAAIIAL